MSQEFTPDLAQLANVQQAAQEQPTVTPEQPVPGTVTTPHQAVQSPVQPPQQQVMPHQAAANRPILPPQDDAFVIPGAEDGPIGGGIVIDNAQLNKPEQLPPTVNQLAPDTMDSLQAYMQDMDKQIAEAAELKAQEEEQKAHVAQEAEEEDTRDIEERYKEAIVVIDKLGAGTVVNFTEEEREKLEKSKKIKLQETEVISLGQLKRKKPKKGNLDKILKRKPAINETPIVLPASGYTAKMKGASTYELISLMGGNENPLIDTEMKWSVIHSKLTETSLGELSFNDFLRATAAIDYNVFIYGLICSTYPDDDKLPLTCVNEKCGKQFEHTYSVRTLLRAEMMTDKLQNAVAKIIDSAHTEAGAKNVHKEAAVNTVKTIKLPMSEYVFEIYVQSAHDLIYNSIKGLTENEEDKYNQASVLSTIVKTAYIPDYDDQDGGYFEYTDAMDITKIIYNLEGTDILVLTKQSEVILDDRSFEFGLMNVECPHCKHHRETVPFDLESILFYRYQQEMNTTVE